MLSILNGSFEVTKTAVTAAVFEDGNLASIRFVRVELTGSGNGTPVKELLFAEYRAGRFLGQKEAN